MCECIKKELWRMEKSTYFRVTRNSGIEFRGNVDVSPLLVVVNNNNKYLYSAFLWSNSTIYRLLSHKQITERETPQQPTVRPRYLYHFLPISVTIIILDIVLLTPHAPLLYSTLFHNIRPCNSTPMMSWFGTDREI